MTDRTRWARSVLATAAFAAALLTTPAALAAPVSVNLRVEGPTGTIFEGPVTTDGHDVTTQAGGTHRCDGTNNGEEPEPGPTATAALDDGTRLGGLTWDGSYSMGFDDFLVDRIGNETADSSSEFWALYVNLKGAQVGGCQLRVNQGEEVLWGLVPFSNQRALRLAGPGDADTGQPVTVRVTDGESGAAQAGATVNGTATGADGRATLTFANAGIYRLKAEQPDAVRSKALVLCVDPPAADACTSADKTPPALKVSIPGGFASDGSQSRTIVVSWQGDEGLDGSGIRTYGVDVREVNDGARASASDWRNLRDGITRTAVHFRGDSGSAYSFRVRATDRANNTGEQTSGIVAIPIDDRDRKLMRLSPGWKRVAKKGAWGRFVVHPRRRGATARVRFRGRRVALIGRRLPKGGRLRVSVAGRSTVITVRGRSGARAVLWTSRRMRAGGHTLRIRALGGGPVELDAVAPLP